MRQPLHVLFDGGRALIAQMAAKRRNRSGNRGIRPKRRRRNRLDRNQCRSLGSGRFEPVRRRTASRFGRSPLARNGYPARKNIEPRAGIPFKSDARHLPPTASSRLRPSFHSVWSGCGIEENAAEVFGIPTPGNALRTPGNQADGRRENQRRSGPHRRISRGNRLRLRRYPFHRPGLLHRPSPCVSVFSP